MAKMHPAAVPVGIALDKTQNAAVEFYHLLAQGLDDGFSVFFRCGIDGVELEHDEMLDFVILHNTHGFLALQIYDGQAPPVAAQGGGAADGKRPRKLPYTQIRKAVHAFIFGLKERGIRFYIPAPCCVVLPHHVRAEFEDRPDHADYMPLFYSDFADLQRRITAMMPLRDGHASNWSVADAVDRIAPLLVTGNGYTAGRGKKSGKKSGGDDSDRPRIIYVVRAIDVFLAVVNIVVLLLLVFFMPESFAQKVAEFLKH